MRTPAIPALSLPAGKIDYRHASGLDMYRHIKEGPAAYEPDVLALLLSLLAPHERSRLINVGANVGYFALAAKRLIGERVDVHAYEPMPELVDRLERGRSNNRVELSIHGRALSDFQGSAPFHLSAKSDTSNSLNPRFRPTKEVIDVNVSTLDADFPEAASEPADADTRTVLLVDTESTEPAVLRGGFAFIARERPAIICEVLARRTEDALAEIVTSIGYRPFALTGTDLEERDTIVGDPTYQHRDWLFLPADEAAPFDLYRATLAAIMATSS